MGLTENLERTWDLGSPPLVDDRSVVAGFQLQERELFNLQALLEHQLHTLMLGRQ